MGLWKRHKAVERDPDLDRVSQGVLARIAALETQLRSVQDALEFARTDIRDARKLSAQVGRIDTAVDQLREARTADVERLDAQIVQVRGLATGGQKRGKRTEATEVGEQLLAAITDARNGDGASLNSMIQELSALVSPNGVGHPQNEPLEAV